MLAGGGCGHLSGVGYPPVESTGPCGGPAPVLDKAMHIALEDFRSEKLMCSIQGNRGIIFYYVQDCEA